MTEDVDDLGTQWLSGILGKLITVDDQGRYVFYSQYTLQPSDEGYTVYRLRDQQLFKFNNRRNAACWCILDKHNKLSEAKFVLGLDQRLASIETHLMIHNRLRKQGNYEQREVNRAKLLAALDTKAMFRRELDKYITLAKQCQQRGFENEPTRTSRKQKN
jgi:hypothetical protein